MTALPVTVIEPMSTVSSRPQVVAAVACPLHKIFVGGSSPTGRGGSAQQADSGAVDGNRSSDQGQGCHVQSLDAGAGGSAGALRAAIQDVGCAAIRTENPV